MAAEHVNDFGGSADLAVLARQVFGGVHFHQRAAAPPPVPRMLPAGPGVFSGRRDAVRSLDRHRGTGARPGRPITVVVTGEGGVGKTALALHWGHQVSADFPDGQLYATLGGRTDVPTSTTEVLGQFLIALGVDAARVPQTLDQRTALYRTLTADRRVLVLLDDALSASQVRPLIPASTGAVVLVTSWHSLDGLGGDRNALLELGRMPEDEALALLGALIDQARVAAERPDAVALTSLCEYLPLAVSAAGARLASRPRWPIARLVHAARQPLDSLTVEGVPVVRAIYDVLYQQLTAPVARLYRLLGHHPGPDVSAESAAALAALPPGEAEDLLQTLAEVHLIEEHGTGYRMHSLILAHAREVATRDEPPGALADAVRRVVEHRLDDTVRADATVSNRFRAGPRYAGLTASPDAAERAAAMEHLSAQAANLAVTVTVAYDHGWHDLVWQLCEALWNLYFRGRDYQAWIRTHELGVRAATESGDPVAQLRMHHQLGCAYLESGRAEPAIAALTRSLGIARSQGHGRGTASALEWLGLAELHRESYAAALAHFDEAVPLTDRDGSPRGRLLIRMHRARALAGLSRFDEAIAGLEPLPARLAALPDRYSQGRCLTILGQTLLAAGRTTEAEPPLRQARDLLDADGATLQTALVDLRLATLAHTQRRPTEAAAALHAALPILRMLNHPELPTAERLLTALDPPTDA
ncbi:NB-ARC domain-containing protein [Catenuloplanes atrovinosus]|uniref:Tetratricopeptide (TPR) repeat protein n=1 Tax=Catenuloplanes atrovinosus TaxID=137266 RepID=A0AAE4CCZ1_9ACTN|nr:NB-ARC domain-containing protein [Catenuloplanes atrovinosus]MDR7277005.1 tetratricopeptide (TPR) repeat protein [Catenuloplanes atrovinosus]